MPDYTYLLEILQPSSKFVLSAKMKVALNVLFCVVPTLVLAGNDMSSMNLPNSVPGRMKNFIDHLYLGVSATHKSLGNHSY